MHTAVIVSAARTPLGRFGGTLRSIGATELGAHVIRAVISRAGLPRTAVDECIMGMVLPCGYGQNPAKQAAILADLPQEVAALTVNKVCGSSLKAVMLAAQAIGCGDAEVVVAGGMENMSMAPYYLPSARWGQRMGQGVLEDHMLHDGLWDIVNDFHMGMSNELICRRWGVSRQEQDHYATRSYRRALDAMDEGRFTEEIAPLTDVGPHGEIPLFDMDECPIPTSYETLAAMAPAFITDGVTTAGNSSLISDGAAAVLVMSRARAEEYGCTVLAEIGAQGAAGIELEHILMAPVYAIPRVLSKEGLTAGQVDLFEINEAFSGASVAVQRQLHLDPGRVNVNGGSIALGHPIGASGARVLVTLLFEMKRRQAGIGLASLCLGGGEAVALVLKR